jgi:gliding motility-associated-like protein
LQNPTKVYAKPGGDKQVTLISRSRLGCIDTVTKTVPISYLNPFAGNDTIIVLGYPYSLNGTGSETYHWSPPDYLSDPNTSNPTVNFPDTGHYTYVLTGSTVQGCVATDTITIQVVKDGSIFVPSAFSPNDDGKNDVLRPITVGYAQINFFNVYNRWGQLVYSSSKNNYPGWNGRYNGRAAELGVYYWAIELIDAFGKKVQQKGDVTLIR